MEADDDLVEYRFEKLRMVVLVCILYMMISSPQDVDLHN